MVICQFATDLFHCWLSHELGGAVFGESINAWGSDFCLVVIFQEREATQYRRVIRKAAKITKLQLFSLAVQILEQVEFVEETFVMWGLIYEP